MPWHRGGLLASPLGETVLGVGAPLELLDRGDVRVGAQEGERSLEPGAGRGDVARDQLVSRWKPIKDSF
jgi:hypothetical protein